MQTHIPLLLAKRLRESDVANTGAIQYHLRVAVRDCADKRDCVELGDIDLPPPAERVNWQADPALVAALEGEARAIIQCLSYLGEHQQSIAYSIQESVFDIALDILTRRTDSGTGTSGKAAIADKGKEKEKSTCITTSSDRKRKRGEGEGESVEASSHTHPPKFNSLLILQSDCVEMVSHLLAHKKLAQAFIDMQGPEKLLALTAQSTASESPFLHGRVTLCLYWLAWFASVMEQVCVRPAWKKLLAYSLDMTRVKALCAKQDVCLFFSVAITYPTVLRQVYTQTVLMQTLM